MTGAQFRASGEDLSRRRHSHPSMPTPRKSEAASWVQLVPAPPTAPAGTRSGSACHGKRWAQHALCVHARECNWGVSLGYESQDVTGRGHCCGCSTGHGHTAMQGRPARLASSSTNRGFFAVIPIQAGRRCWAGPDPAACPNPHFLTLAPVDRPPRKMHRRYSKGCESARACASRAPSCPRLHRCGSSRPPSRYSGWGSASMRRRRHQRASWRRTGTGCRWPTNARRHWGTPLSLAADGTGSTAVRGSIADGPIELASRVARFCVHCAFGRERACAHVCMHACVTEHLK